MTESTARAVWSALDPATRDELDAAVAAGRPAPDPALALVGMWRALRRRREWTVALVVPVPALVAAVVLGLPGSVVAVLVALLAMPVHRLHLVHRALVRNVDLALRVPQRGTPPERPATSELGRHLAARASRRV